MMRGRETEVQERRRRAAEAHDLALNAGRLAQESDKVWVPFDQEACSVRTSY